MPLIYFLGKIKDFNPFLGYYACNVTNPLCNGYKDWINYKSIIYNIYNYLTIIIASFTWMILTSGLILFFLIKILLKWIIFKICKFVFLVLLPFILLIFKLQIFENIFIILQWNFCTIIILQRNFIQIFKSLLKSILVLILHLLILKH